MMDGMCTSSKAKATSYDGWQSRKNSGICEEF